MAFNAFFYLISSLEVLERFIVLIVMTFPALGFKHFRVLLLIIFLMFAVGKHNDGLLMILVSLGFKLDHILNGCNGVNTCCQKNVTIPIINIIDKYFFFINIIYPFFNGIELLIMLFYFFPSPNVFVVY